jgi:hypothetical protein
MMKMTRVLGLTMVILFWWTVSGAEAACSGSGQTWNCTAGTTPAQINTTLSSASDGATLTFDAGSYTWGGGTIITPSISKGVTFACQTGGTCNVSWSSTVWATPTGSSSKLYRWTGFNFVAAASARAWWWHCPGGLCAETQLTQLRVDHNNFNLEGDESVLLTDTASVSYLYGVIDHNIFNINSMSAVTFDYSGAVDNTPSSGRLGSAQNLFVEDNVFTITRLVDGGVGCVDGWHVGVGIVWRFNSMTNCRTLLHGVPHAWGPSNFEVYGNAYNYNANSVFPSGYRSIHHQGSGTYAAWGNAFNTASHDPNTIVVLHYRAFQNGIGGICDGTNGQDGNRSPQSAYQGYPCKHQPGRDNNGQLYPMFAFLNRWTNDGSKVDLVVNGGGTSPDYTGSHLRQNRDFYNAVSNTAQTSAASPFNGTTGMGYGPLALRPATCSTTTEAADAGRGGVMYWATDQGNWNSSSSNPQGVQQNGADGVLYLCSATNTWSVYYTPYSYPHPLQAGAAGGGGSGSGMPAAPTNLHLIPSQ